MASRNAPFTSGSAASTERPFSDVSHSALWIQRIESPRRAASPCRKDCTSWARCPVTTMKSVMPASLMLRMFRSMSGTPSTGRRGLLLYSELSRLPLPAANITHCMLALPCAANEFFGHDVRLFVGVLARGMLAEVGRGRIDYTALSAIEGKLGAAHHVNGNARRVGRIFHGQAQLQIHGHIAKEPSFHAQKADLVVLLPRDIIARAHVDVVFIKTVFRHRLHRFCLGDLLGFQPLAIEHVEKVGITAGIELIGAIQLHAALGKQVRECPMGNGGAQLRLDIIADKRQIPFFEALRPLLSRAIKTGILLTKATPASSAHSA